MRGTNNVGRLEERSRGSSSDASRKGVDDSDDDNLDKSTYDTANALHNGHYHLLHNVHQDKVTGNCKKYTHTHMSMCKTISQSISFSHQMAAHSFKAKNANYYWPLHKQFSPTANRNAVHGYVIKPKRTGKARNCPNLAMKVANLVQSWNFLP